MNAFVYKPVVTVVDVLEAGACIDGVKDFIKKHAMVIAGATSDFLRQEWVKKAANGDGYGDGSGSGYGYGYGYGDGDGEYWKATILYFAAKWTPEQRERLRHHMDAESTIAFWRSDENGMPANGGQTIKPASPGVVHTAQGPLTLCAAGTLHATLTPIKWVGDRWWIVALVGEVIGDDEKLGCLHREIIGEAS
jgi:hypothetical protein